MLDLMWQSHPERSSTHALPAKGGDRLGCSRFPPFPQGYGLIATHLDKNEEQASRIHGM
jgi:hypothetical protein